MFDKVLVANRGEIAIRVFRTLRELGIGSVGVYSEGDRAALHVAYADEAFLLGPTPAAESYLAVDRILDAAQRAGAQAVHPGYGFLAENASFAQAVEDAGLVWIGPPPAAIELMGNKTAARTAMKAAGVPIIPGTTDPVGSVDELLALGEEIGYPLLIKAAAGGGGKGMEEVHDPAQAEEGFERARRQGQSYFANPDVYVEKLIVDPRHVEVQVLADSHGNVVHLGERDCTIQRRHQKLVEETPSPAVDEELRQRIGAIGVEAARACGYRSAGTIEGLLTQDGDYFFMEMNTRIQVEHTVTEMVTGLDLVREQIRVALGEPLSVRQEDVELRGHAIECRINAEDAAQGFLPAPAPVTGYREPAGPGVRVDSGVAAGYEVSALVRPDGGEAHRARRRPRARTAADAARARRVLDRGADHADRLPQGAPLASVLRRRRDVPRRSSSPRSSWPICRADAVIAPPAGLVSQDAGKTTERVRTVEVDGRRFEVRLSEPEPEWRALARRRRERAHRRRRRRGRQRRRRLADAGHGPLRGGGRRRRGRGRPGDLHRRGDEDGERGARAPRRHRPEPLRRARPARDKRPGHLQIEAD